MNRGVIVGAIGGASLIALALGVSLGWYVNDSLGETQDGGEIATMPTLDASAAPPPTSDVPLPAYVGEVGGRRAYELPTVVVVKTQKRLHASPKVPHFFDFKHAKHCDRVESVSGSVTRCE